MERVSGVMGRVTRQPSKRDEAVVCPREWSKTRDTQKKTKNRTEKKTKDIQQHANHSRDAREKGPIPSQSTLKRMTSIIRIGT